MQDIGLVRLGGELTHPLVNSDGRSAVVATLEAVRPVLSQTSFVKEGRIDRLIALCSDPTLVTTGGSTLSLWGQRSA